MATHGAERQRWIELAPDQARARACDGETLPPRRTARSNSGWAARQQEEQVSSGTTSAPLVVLLSEISEKLGVSRTRVRKLVNSSLRASWQLTCINAMRSSICCSASNS